MSLASLQQTTCQMMIKTPYLFVGDDAFPLWTYMIKSYGRNGLDIPQRIYNYRTSRCRRVCENAFGILANWFGCLTTTITFQLYIASTIVLAAIWCQNLIRIRYPAIQNAVMDRDDANNQVISREWRRGNTWEQELQHIPGNRETKAGKQQWKYLKHYYNSVVGAVPWQADMI